MAADPNFGGRVARPASLNLPQISTDALEQEQGRLVQEVSRQVKTFMLAGKEVKPEDLVEVKTLGKGQFGTVVEMKYGATSMAVKKMIFGDQQKRENIVRDLRWTRKLSHENIIGYYGSLLVFDREVWLCLELMDTSLQGLFDAMAAKGMQSVPMDHAAKIILCILRALSHLQDRVINGEARPIMHRDLYPPNVLLSRNGDVKLTDFGCVGRLTGSVADTNNHLGMIYYLAPERCGALSDYGSRADVWSLGLIGYQMEMGEHLFSELIKSCNSSDTELLAAIHNRSQSLTELASFRRFSELFGSSRDHADYYKFVTMCLRKNHRPSSDPTRPQRPNFKDLLQLSFMRNAAKRNVNVGPWVAELLPVDNKGASNWFRKLFKSCRGG